MTFKEHQDAVSAAAKEVYEAIERANCHGIIVEACVEVSYCLDECAEYFPTVNTELLSKGRKVMTEDERVLRGCIEKAMAELADALTSAGKDGYSFTVKRMHGGMFMVKPAESSIEV